MTTYSTPKSPLLRFHGGKWRIAPKIIPNFPTHKIYVEPFCGGTSVLLRKPRSYAEIINDLDGEVVNLFRMVRDYGDELRRLIELTPFAREEFNNAYKPTNDNIERARNMMIRSFMGFSTAGVGAKLATGFRAQSNRSGTTPAHDWANLPGSIPALVDRLRGVVIENRPAEKVVLHQDSKDTLFYVDPPYVASTRDKGADYAFEMTDDDHRELGEVLRSVQGKVVLSGYASDIYDLELFPDWRRVDIAAFADGASPRTEILWMNFEPSNGLFGGIE